MTYYAETNTPVSIIGNISRRLYIGRHLMIRFSALLVLENKKIESRISPHNHENSLSSLSTQSYALTIREIDHTFNFITLLMSARKTVH